MDKPKRIIKAESKVLCQIDKLNKMRYHNNNFINGFTAGQALDLQNIAGQLTFDCIDLKRELEPK